MHFAFRKYRWVLLTLRYQPVNSKLHALWEPRMSGLVIEVKLLSILQRKKMIKKLSLSERRKFLSNSSVHCAWCISFSRNTFVSWINWKRFTSVQEFFCVSRTSEDNGFRLKWKSLLSGRENFKAGTEQNCFLYKNVKSDF